MNFDKIFFYTWNRRQIFDREIPPERIIKSRFTHKEESSELYVIFPSWGGNFYLNHFLRRRFMLDGYSFLEYQFSKGILSTDKEMTLKYFKAICEKAKGDIEKLKKEHNFQKIKVIGISIGCVNACMMAENNPNINELILVVPGHCLAESMWQGFDTQELRKTYEKEGATLPELKKYWHDLAPENNINNLKCEKVSIFLSRADIVIPFCCGEKLAEKLKFMKYNLSCHINKHLGHNLTAISFLLNPKKYLK